MAHPNRFVVARRSIDNIPANAVGLVEKSNGTATVFFIGAATVKVVSVSDIKNIDIYKTGKGFTIKICNVCHVLKPTDEFDVNQRDASGRPTTRPSCRSCRQHIDGKAILSSEKEEMNKTKPARGDVFHCCICNKRSIVDVTAKIVLDHCHITGAARDWICDSCNTGLGRFKDSVSLLKDAIAYLQMHDEKSKNE